MVGGPQPRSQMPPPIRPQNVLDTVLAEGGPLPSARLRIRGLAFLLDFVLLTVASSVIIWKFAVPQAHPGAYQEFTVWTAEFLQWWSTASAERGEFPGMSDNLRTALAYARDLQLLICWFYFAAGEAFFGGNSLGKRACRLRSISTVTLEKPGLLTGIVRGGLKTVALFFIFPIGLLATLGALFFNKRRQMGHDLLSRTAVVDDSYIQSPNERA